MAIQFETPLSQIKKDLKIRGPREFYGIIAKNYL